MRFDLHDGNNEFIIKILGHRIGNRKKKKRRHKVHKKKTAGSVAGNEVSVKPVQEKETSDYVYEDDEFPDRKLPINRKLTMSDRRKIKKMFSKT